MKIKNTFYMDINGDFETLRKNTLCFVDRSLLILKLFNSFKNQDSFFITYPRGTGKTVNLSMIKDFCEL